MYHFRTEVTLLRNNNHVTSQCRFKDAICHGCNKTGHIKPVCSKRHKHLNTKHLDLDYSGDSNTGNSDSGSVDKFHEKFHGVYSVGSHNYLKVKPYTVIVKGNECDFTMEIDTSASRSTISEPVYREKLSGFALYNCPVSLTSYSEQKISTLRCIRVPLRYNNVAVESELIVVKGNRPCLLGRDILIKIKLDWASIFTVSSETNLDKVAHSTNLDELSTTYKELFQQDNGGIRGFKASLKLKANVKPVYQKSRPVPYAIRDVVAKEYERLIKSDILYEVDHSDWASPAVHVQKGDKSIRVCGDFKAVNELIEDDGYKLPTSQDLVAKLAQNGQPKVFSVLDLKGANGSTYVCSYTSKECLTSTQHCTNPSEERTITSNLCGFTFQ